MTADHEQALTSPALRRASRLMAGAVALFSAGALLTWWRGGGSALAFSQSQVPIAPATALLTVLLAVAVYIRARPHPEDPSIADALVPTATLILAGYFGACYLLGVESPLEHWLAGPLIFRDGIPLGRISVITSALLGTIALALAIGRTRLSAYQGPLATLALAASFVILQGYVLGAPLLYGSRTIPVAAPTAILAWLLALATVLLTRPDDWPLRVIMPTSRMGVLPSKRNFFWLALLFAAVVGSSGYYWYVSQAERAEEDALTTLRTVAELKAAEIGIWYGDIRSTTTAFAGAPFDEALIAAAQAPRGAPERAALRRWLTGTREDGDYSGIVLFDSSGRELIRVENENPRPTPLLQQQFRALRGDTLQATPIFEIGTAIRKNFWVPLHVGASLTGPPSAWLAFIVDIDRQLFPRLAELPTDYRSIDVTLWRIESDSARLLTPSRAGGIRPLRYAVGLDSSARANLLEPLASPRGYAGPGFTPQEVRAVQREVPGTEWTLVVSVDAEELRQPVLAAAVRATVLSFFFLLAAAAAIYALWYRRDLTRAREELSLIEDRERGLREIEASEQRYARAMRGTTDGLWDLNMLTGEAYVSPRWREIAGVTDERIHDEATFLACLHPEDVPRQLAALTAHREKGVPYDLELRLHPRLGNRERWIRTRGEIERDADGKPVWMSGTITDITYQHETEEEVRRNARLLRVRSAVNQAIVRAEDEDALLHMVVEILVHDGGYRMAWIGKREDDAAKSVRPLAIAGDERGYLAENPITWGEDASGQGPVGRCLRSGQPQVAQRLVSERDFAPWRDAAEARGYKAAIAIPLVIEGETFGAVTIYADEADAFDTEELNLLTALGLDVAFGIAALRNDVALRAQREQLYLFRQAIDRSADAIFVADVDTGKFVDFNVACLEQLGYTAAELTTLGPADIVTDLDARGGLTVVAQAVRAAGGLVRPSLHRRKDGHEVPVEVALSVLDIGHRVLILGIARDISDRLKADSEREELQALLTRSQKMESVGRLAGGVAHDFNNLLTVINTTAELGLSEVERGSALEKDLREIRAAGDRAAALTRQLLAFSRQQVFKREVLDLNAVVSGFLTLLSRVIGEDIHVEIKLGREVPNILADAHQLEQVLMNLCVNARDAMPRGGTLTIGTGIATVDDEHAARREGMTPGRYATLSVSDTGIGMDRATQAKIFDPFFTTKETGRGTGLGLATVYGIVKQTGGSIWVYSELGKGSTFRIYLPITGAAATEATSAKPTATATTGHETILVVEDEDSIRFVARRVLERAGYTVHEANSGEAAIAAIAAHEGPLDLVMTDLVMPGMSGLELATELRSRYPKLKFLFTSGYSTEAVSEHFLHDGEWNFIAKPYGVAELVAEVRRVLDA